MGGPCAQLPAPFDESMLCAGSRLGAMLRAGSRRGAMLRVGSWRGAILHVGSQHGAMLHVGSRRGAILHVPEIHAPWPPPSCQRLRSLTLTLRHTPGNHTTMPLYYRTSHGRGPLKLVNSCVCIRAQAAYRYILLPPITPYLCMLCIHMQNN